MYAVTIPIIRTEQSTLLFDKRFALMNRGHNVIVRRARHLLHRLDHDLEYQSWRKEYIAFLKKEADQQKKGLELSRDEFARKSRLSKLMGRRRQDIGLTKYGLEKYATVWRKPHANHIASHQMQKEADRVWAGVEKVLFGNGKDIVKQVGGPIATSRTYFVFRKDEPELQEAVDGALKQLKESGRLAEISREVLGDDYTERE